MREVERVNVNVYPDLEKVVLAAREANIIIQDLQFVQDVDSDILSALALVIEGTTDAKSYFAWLLDKQNLHLPALG